MRWNHIEENPFRKTDKPKLRELLPLYFTKEEFLRVLNCETDGDLRDLYIFAVFTGMRLGEIMALQWVDVDIERKLILVCNSETFTTKSGRVRRVPMNADVVHILRAREAAHAGPTVFTFNGGRLTKDIASRHFKTCVIKAGVNPKLHFHSLRHTFATWLVQAEAPIFEVQRLLGHSSIEMTQIYAHRAASELHGTAKRICSELAERVNQNSPEVSRTLQYIRVCFGHRVHDYFNPHSSSPVRLNRLSHFVPIIVFHLKRPFFTIGVKGAHGWCNP